MELWIRTQLKNGLIKVNDIYVGSREGMYSLESKDFVLGMYKTEKRALEVLDEIQKLLEPFAKIQIPYTANILSLQDLSTYVYEMPKE